MSNKNKINFSAADIEKYHKGQLSAKEMHELEKAALDDPFLADALEGYYVRNVNVSADLAELKKRLAEKTGKAKVIPITSRSARSSFTWLRVAVMLVLVAGAGLLVYQLAFTGKKQNQDIAQAPATSKQEIKQNSNDSQTAIEANALTGAVTNQLVDEQKDIPSIASQEKSAGLNNKENTEENTQANSPPVYSISDAAGQKDTATEVSTLVNEKKELLQLNEQRKIAAVPKVQGHNADLATTNRSRQGKPANLDHNEDGYTSTAPGRVSRKIFRGQVTDSNNNALPFANITNTADNIGTYTDAKGNFVLTSPDSVLNVQVRSVGFENNSIQLQNHLMSNQVVMQEDRNVSAVVISNRKANSNRSRNNNMVFEEPEPVDGWNNYDTYITNNLNMPETRADKKINGGEVQLSFEVSEDGQPINITVDRSLCESCDKEAIRLLKQGPKWRQKAKKRGRTTVTIPF